MCRENMFEHVGFQDFISSIPRMENESIVRHCRTWILGEILAQVLGFTSTGFKNSPLFFCSLQVPAVETRR